MSIPLNVNGRSKTAKISRSQSPQKKSSSNPQSPRGRKSFTRSILNKYKSVKSSSKKRERDDDQKAAPLGISGPLNVQHVIHVEWDDQRKAYKVEF